MFQLCSATISCTWIKIMISDSFIHAIAEYYANIVTKYPFALDIDELGVNTRHNN